MAARRVLPPDLIVPADASAPRMKLTGPEAVPPPFSSFVRGADARQVDAGTRAALEDVPSSMYQLRIESIESSTARMKQADACCGTPGTPMLNQTGELNAAFWWMMRYFSSCAEGLGLRVVDEVAVLHSPGRDRVDHPVDHLLQRPLALRGAERSPEVLLRQDVGGVDAPRLGNLDAELLEGHGPIAEVGDSGVTPLPRDLVVGIVAFGGEVPVDADPGPLRGDGHGRLLPSSASLAQRLPD